MPDIQALLDNTETVVFQRGKLQINCEAFLERISPENAEYAALVEAGQSLLLERQTLAARISLFEDTEWVASFLMGAVIEESTVEGEEPTARFPTADEITKRDTELKKELKALQKAVREMKGKGFRHACERLALLLHSWDVTSEDKPLATDAATIEKAFKSMPETVVLLRQRIESQVFGPLATRPDSTL